MVGSTDQPTGEQSSSAGAAAAAQAGSENQSKSGPQQADLGAQGRAQEGQTAEPIDKVAALGHGAWLMSQVPTHKHFFIADIEWMLVPPVATGQFRLWRNEGMPVGFATWALLSEDAEKRILEGGIRRLAPKDWNSGPNVWLMDLLTPFGGREEAVREMKEQVFPGKTIKTLQAAPDGNGVVMVEL